MRADGIGRAGNGGRARVDRAIVGPVDGRMQVLDTRHFPFNTVCHVARDFGDGRLHGCSGVLVGPRLVLTAGHCLFSLKRGRTPVRILVSPGRGDRATRPFGTLQAKSWYAPRRFLLPGSSSRKRRANDYGFIVLPRPFARIRRFVPVAAPSDAALAALARRGRLGIAGYPGDRPIGTMWYHRERLARFDDKRLHYTVDTCPGHSGSPIWLENARRRPALVVGVHTSGIVDRLGRSRGCKKGATMAPPGSLNSGVRLDARIAAAARRPTRGAFRAVGLVPLALGRGVSE